MWKELCDIVHKAESAICLLTKLPKCGKCANKTSTMWKVRVITKPPQCGKYAEKTSIM